MSGIRTISLLIRLIEKFPKNTTIYYTNSDVNHLPNPFSRSCGRTSPNIQFYNRASNATRQHRKRRHSARLIDHCNIQSAKRPKSTSPCLCHSANSNGQLTSTFPLFAIDLHHLCSDSSIIWRNLVFYHSS